MPSKTSSRVLTIPRAALVSGGAIRDVPAGRFLLFITLWSLLVYYPVARWSWHWAGWSNQYGAMDFAGGTAVHITSGTTVLAFNIFYTLDTKGFARCWSGICFILDDNLKPILTPCTTIWPFRKARVFQFTNDGEHESDGHELERRSTVDSENVDVEASTHSSAQSQVHQAPERLGLGPDADEPPHNVNNMVLGTALLWIGWLGFNGGSALGGNLRAVSACVSTHVAACSGGTTSLLIFWLWNAVSRALSEEENIEHKVPSVTHFCDGVVIALVAITPAAGYASIATLDNQFQLTKARYLYGAPELLDPSR